MSQSFLQVLSTNRQDNFGVFHFNSKKKEELGAVEEETGKGASNGDMREEAMKGVEEDLKVAEGWVRISKREGDRRGDGDGPRFPHRSCPSFGEDRVSLGTQVGPREATTKVLGKVGGGPFGGF